mmetsp:Transcript_24166/g.42938  ORF Transcript_24166/g.42938 Transcript_24166/m.42938 type:complete len:268 (-) Transcript_24166:2532-3335(-)
MLEGSDRTAVDISSAILQNRIEREADALISAPSETMRSLLSICNQKVRETTLGAKSAEVSVIIFVQTASDLHLISLGHTEAALAKLKRLPSCVDELNYMNLIEQFEDKQSPSQECLQERISENQSDDQSSKASVGELVESPARKVPDAEFLREDFPKPSRPKPRYYKYSFDSMTDLFLILGSKALWHAMPPHDAVSFVQKHRRQSIKNSELQPPRFPTERTTSIAHFLCSEAFTRQVKESAVKSEDSISCVILEFSWTSPQATFKFS